MIFLCGNHFALCLPWLPLLVGGGRADGLRMNWASDEAAPACDRFKDDVASKVVLSPIIFEGRARRLEMASWDKSEKSAKFEQSKYFNVTFKPRSVYKGFLAPSPRHKKELAAIVVGKFGLNKDEACVPSVQLGSRYIIFLKEGFTNALHDTNLRYYEMAQWPEPLTRKALHLVIDYVCPNCTSPPAIKPVENEKRVMAMQRLNLRCQATGRPPPQVTWYKDGYLIINKQAKILKDSGGSSLHLSEAGTGDSGVYECRATNVVGEARSKSIAVKVWPVSQELASGCDAHHCLHGGSCFLSSKLDYKICQCTSNFTGSRCENAIIFLNKFEDHEQFERKIEYMLYLAIFLLTIIIIILIVFIVCLTKRYKVRPRKRKLGKSSELKDLFNLATWHEMAVQTEPHYENCQQSQFQTNTSNNKMCFKPHHVDNANLTKTVNCVNQTNGILPNAEQTADKISPTNKQDVVKNNSITAELLVHNKYLKNEALLKGEANRLDFKRHILLDKSNNRFSCNVEIQTDARPLRKERHKRRSCILEKLSDKVSVRKESNEHMNNVPSSKTNCLNEINNILVKESKDKIIKNNESKDASFQNSAKDKAMEKNADRLSSEVLQKYALPNGLDKNLCSNYENLSNGQVKNGFHKKILDINKARLEEMLTNKIKQDKLIELSENKENLIRDTDAILYKKDNNNEIKCDMMILSDKLNKELKTYTFPKKKKVPTATLR